MKNPDCNRNSSRKAFTLVELMVVIAIIGILAALLLTVTGTVSKKKKIAVAQAELAQVETFIDDYKAKMGFYPPDNPANATTGFPGNPIINQLYFELSGTLLTNNGQLLYITLDGSGQITATPPAPPAAFQAAYGPGTSVGGFMNSTKGGNADDAPTATKFLKNVRPTQTAAIDPGNPLVKTLVCSVGWPDTQAYQPLPLNKGANPWRYISSSPNNNPNSYDLWVDLYIAGKTNRVSNWSKQPQIF